MLQENTSLLDTKNSGITQLTGKKNEGTNKQTNEQTNTQTNKHTMTSAVCFRVAQHFVTNQILTYKLHFMNKQHALILRQFYNRTAVHSVAAGRHVSAKQAIIRLATMEDKYAVRDVNWYRSFVRRFTDVTNEGRGRGRI